MEHRTDSSGNIPKWRSIPKREAKAMWYVIQTITGREDETVGLIDKVLRKKEYKRCFVIKRECVWKIEGRYRIHIEPLFPSYIFVETECPDDFFYALKRVPKLTKLLGSDGKFWMVEPEEVDFLKKMADEDDEYVVRRSLVKVNAEGEIIYAEGVLKEYKERIVRKRLRKRVVIVEIPFLGKMRRIQLGVRLQGDEEISCRV